MRVQLATWADEFGLSPVAIEFVGFRVMARKEQAIPLTDVAGPGQRFRQAGMTLSKGELI